MIGEVLLVWLGVWLFDYGYHWTGTIVAVIATISIVYRRAKELKDNVMDEDKIAKFELMLEGFWRKVKQHGRQALPLELQQLYDELLAAEEDARKG